VLMHTERRTERRLLSVNQRLGTAPWETQSGAGRL
jgi:hypothetical protein